MPSYARPVPRSAGNSHSNVLRGRDGKVLDKHEIECLPSMDSRLYYDPPLSPESSCDSDSSDFPAPAHITSNSGNKLNLAARFVRRGKVCAWGPSYDEVRTDHRIRRRMKMCLEQLLPEAAAEVGTVAPQNIQKTEAKRVARKRKREEDKEYVLPHLASPSPPTSTRRLAPMLALPQTYMDIMLSPAMRHSLGDDGVEQGLQRTAAELLEGERGLMQACGRLREVLRVRARDVPVDQMEDRSRVRNGNHLGLNGHTGFEGIRIDAYGNIINPANDASKIPPLPHISDTDNLWRVTQELLQAQPPPTIQFTVTPPGGAQILNPLDTQPTPTPVHRLFTHPSGLTVNAIPSINHPGRAYPPAHPAHPKQTKYNLDLANQCRAVDDALERISELLADCNEYKERLEEAMSRVGDVARARKKVWNVVKERAGWELDRQEGRS